MDENQRIAINGVVGFGLTAGLGLLLGQPLTIALPLGVLAGIAFAVAIYYLGRYEESRLD